MRILLLGALGEVGGSIGQAFAAAGHTVLPVSSRAPHLEGSGIRSPAKASEALRRGEIDLVVNASGRGDRRESERSGQDATMALAGVISACGVPGILISTIRVLEGYDGPVAGDAEPRPLTPYARANADHEALWLRSGRLSVLRIANFFCTPQSRVSPQVGLLPWSLLLEGVTTGRIGIRSGPKLTKEFVSAADVASAVLHLGQVESSGVVASTAPGTPFRLEELAGAVSTAMSMAGMGDPEISYGADSGKFVPSAPGLLAELGWKASLGLGEIQETLSSWIIRNGLEEPSAG